jgi:hypothetical protein
MTRSAAFIVLVALTAAPLCRAGQAGGNAPTPPKPQVTVPVQGNQPTVIRTPPARPSSKPQPSPGTATVDPTDKEPKIVDSGDAYSWSLTPKQRKLLDGSTSDSSSASSIDAQKLWAALIAYKAATEFKSTDAEEPLPWVPLVRSAFSAAKKKQIPFAAYVSDEQHFALAGEGTALWEAWKKEHSGTTPSKTAFEFAEVRDAFTAAGIRLFSKVQASAEEDELLLQAGLASNTLVLYAPNGDRLAKLHGEDLLPKNLCQFLQHEFPNKLEAWREKQSFLNAGTEASSSPSDSSLVQPERKNP